MTTNIEIDILSRINEFYPRLQGVQKRIADTIVADLEFASVSSITELAIKSGVSEASITRFTQKIGCKNIRELKYKIAKSLASSERYIYDIPDETGIAGIFEGAKSSIVKNRGVISNELLDKVCEQIIFARQIIVIGMGGGSTIFAQELQYRLFRLGLVVVSYNDGLLSRMVASTVEKNDVFIALSVTGSTPEVNESAEIAKQYGATIIAITQSGSELDKLSDLTLPIITEENDYIYKPTSSRYAMLIVIDILSYRLAVMNKPYSKDKLRRIQISLNNHRQGGDRHPLGD